jgi:hypothetical protein
MAMLAGLGVDKSQASGNSRFSPASHPRRIPVWLAWSDVVLRQHDVQVGRAGPRGLSVKWAMSTGTAVSSFVNLPLRRDGAACPFLPILVFALGTRWLK